MRRSTLMALAGLLALSMTGADDPPPHPAPPPPPVPVSPEAVHAGSSAVPKAEAIPPLSQPVTPSPLLPGEAVPGEPATPTAEAPSTTIRHAAPSPPGEAVPLEAATTGEPAGFEEAFNGSAEHSHPAPMKPATEPEHFHAQPHPGRFPINPVLSPYHAREVSNGDPAWHWVLPENGARVNSLSGSNSVGFPMIGETSTSGNSPSAADPKAVWRTFVFDNPAFFPRLAHASHDATQPRDGLLIREGMALRLAENGDYELDFEAEAEPIDISFSLQIVIQVGGERFTITQPSVRLNRGQDDQTPDGPSELRIVRRGTLSLVKRVLETGKLGPHGGYPILVERVGVARFGGGVQGATSRIRR